MRILFGRPFGGKAPVIGRFVPSAAEDDDKKDAPEEDAPEEETAEDAAEEDEGADAPEGGEGDDDEESAAEEDGTPEAATAAERARWTGVMAQLDMSPAACIAVEALAEGLSPEAAMRMAGRAGGTTAPAAQTGAAAMAARRGKRPAMPRASGGTTDAGAERRDRMGARLDAAGYAKKGKR